MNAIEVTNVSKVYRRYGRRKQFATLKSALLSGGLLAELRPEDTFLALDDVSFEVEQGKTFGIIGRNGSGKSTALKLVAGITKPTSGSVHVNGRVSALIELGAGFHPEISGRENVFINGMMLGLSRREIQKRFDDIVEFAELQDFIDAPVKTYSSGMYMRLGFAVAINVDPDVLLVDEVLAVGDEAFTHKCIDKFAEFRRHGKTVLIVTHTLDLVTRFCDETLWLDRGRIRALGDPRRIVDAYITDVQRAENEQLAKEDAGRRARVGGGEIDGRADRLRQGVGESAGASAKAEALPLQQSNVDALRPGDRPTTTDAGQGRMDERAQSAGDPRSTTDVSEAGVDQRPERATDVVRSDQTAQPPGDQRPTTDVGEAPEDMFKAVEGHPSTSSGHPEPPGDMFKAVEGRWGSREAEIASVSLVGPDGRAGHVFPAGEPLSIRLTLRAPERLRDIVVGVAIFSAEGACCYGTNSDVDGIDLERLEGAAEVTFRINRLDLIDGTYKLDVAVHRHNGVPYDYHRQLYTFRVKSKLRDVGIARLAHTWNMSGGLVVGQPSGDGDVGRDSKSPGPRPPDDVRAHSTSDPRPTSGVVLSTSEAAAWSRRLGASGQRVVFTNGVFDILHPGHVRYLQDARKLGDALVVAVNSDRSVRANKGPLRPVNPEGERAELLAALGCVDAIVIFDEDTPYEIIRAIEPDVLVKGADWGPDNIVGRDVVEARGGRVVRVPLAEGYSTTNIIDKVRQATGR